MSYAAQLYQGVSLSHDPIHGYIAFTASSGVQGDEVSEQAIIDHPWVQRLRHIHQLQSAWWVFPSAEHTRFQHVLGAMHLASRAVDQLYDTLRMACPDCPSRGYVETLTRLAALLHDVGHGPFGHFFDQHYLSKFGLTHETLGAEIIRRELGDLLRRIRRNPHSRLTDDEILDPEHVAALIVRPRNDAAEPPRWLALLRALFCGLYTVDNMDFVLRDAYMSGYSHRAFDLERLLHYSFFSPQGLTIHERGLSSLVRFISVRAELFRSIYFHRTVRAIDLALQDLFRDGAELLFPGNPLEQLDRYREFTESSLWNDVRTWVNSEDEQKRELGRRWCDLIGRKIEWKMVCERAVFFGPQHSEEMSVFSTEELFAAAVRKGLPAELRDLELRFDPPRHVHRPGTRAPAGGQNFLYDPATDTIRSLDDRELFRQIPVSCRLCRIYAKDLTHHAKITQAMDDLLGGAAVDDPTNM